MNKTKRAIFDAAIKEFSGNGYTGTSVDHIALSAGVAKGTLYYHFTSKEEIFNFIIIQGMELLNQQIMEVTNEEEDLILKLRQLCKVQLGMIHENRDFFKVVMSQLWGREIRQIQLRTIVRKYIDDIDLKLKNAMSKGLVKSASNNFMAYFFFGTICSAAVYEIINADDDIEKIIDQLMEYLLHGIKA